MNPDVLSSIILGMAAFFAVDAGCYFWLRSKAGHPAYRKLTVRSPADIRARRSNDR